MASLPNRFQSPSAQRGNPRLARVGGAGFTVFHWESKPLAFARSVQVMSAQPVAQPVAIQPMDAAYPLEAATTAAVGLITLRVQFFETYNSNVWDDILAVTDRLHPTQTPGPYHDLKEVLQRLAGIGRGIQMTRFIYPPNRISRIRTQHYARTYHNVRVGDIRDDENIAVDTVEVVKEMTMLSTHSTSHRANS